MVVALLGVPASGCRCPPCVDQKKAAGESHAQRLSGDGACQPLFCRRWQTPVVGSAVVFNLLGNYLRLSEVTGHADIGKVLLHLHTSQQQLGFPRL